MKKTDGQGFFASQNTVTQLKEQEEKLKNALKRQETDLCQRMQNIKDASARAEDLEERVSELNVEQGGVVCTAFQWVINKIAVCADVSVVCPAEKMKERMSRLIEELQSARADVLAKDKMIQWQNKRVSTGDWKSMGREEEDRNNVSSVLNRPGSTAHLSSQFP